MAKKADTGKSTPKSKAPTSSPVSAPARPSALLDTRVIFTAATIGNPGAPGKNLPDACVDLIYIDPALVSEVELPFNSNRNSGASGVFWGETKEKRAFDDRRASMAVYIDYMQPRCVQLIPIRFTRILSSF